MLHSGPFLPPSNPARQGLLGDTEFVGQFIEARLTRCIGVPLGYHRPAHVANAGGDHRHRGGSERRPVPATRTVRERERPPSVFSCRENALAGL